VEPRSPRRPPLGQSLLDLLTCSDHDDQRFCGRSRLSQHMPELIQLQSKLIE
jgi:hypothetical protein